MKLLDGKALSEIIKAEISVEVKRILASGKPVPHLAAILVGNDGAAETYVGGKVRACEQTGIRSSLIRFPDSVSEKELLDKIAEINSDKTIHGLIVQLPLPKHISEEKVIQQILPSKDVDGFHPANFGRMASGLSSYIPATPFGILLLLERNEVPTEGKHCVILGRSHIVGKPLSILLSRNEYPGNCTVTLCHSKTKNIEQFTQQADILIAALGKPGFVKAGMVKEGAVVVDVGITRLPAETKSGYRLQGDVAFNEVAPKCSFITPVPGGVGPMTIIGLLMNTLKAASGDHY